MKFQPTMFFGQGERCTTGTANGGISGSFVSGSETWQYFEFKAINEDTGSGYQFQLEKGFTRRAIIMVVAGGGAGGNTGLGANYRAGGGGGGGQVIFRTGVDLYPGIIHNIYVGKGGARANPNAPIGQKTYDGGNGELSSFSNTIGSLSYTALPGEGGKGDDNPIGTIGDGGNSGNGFLGGNGITSTGGGGGGSNGNGQSYVSTPSNLPGDGGSGFSFTFPHKTYSVGGGGGGGSNSAIFSERGIGVNGGGYGSSATSACTDATASTGGGGGGGELIIDATTYRGSHGASGIVFICFPIGKCP